MEISRTETIPMSSNGCSNFDFHTLVHINMRVSEPAEKTQDLDGKVHIELLDVFIFVVKMICLSALNYRHISL